MSHYLKALVRRGLIPPSLVGHEELPEVALSTVAMEVNLSASDFWTRAGSGVRPQGALASPVPRTLRKTFTAYRLGRIRIAQRFDIWGNGYFLAGHQDRKLLYSGHQFDRELARVIFRRGDVGQIDEGIWVFERWAANYYHWMIRHLPKILAMRRYLPAVPLLVPAAHRFTNWQRDSLLEVGVSEEDFVTVDEPVFEIKSGVIPDMSYVDAHALGLVRAEILSRYPQSRGRKVYISREDAGCRRVCNEQEVRALCMDYGIQVLELSGLPLAAQIESISGADVIVGAHGAGLSNMLWCAPDAKVIELIRVDQVNSHFELLAANLGFGYRRVLCEPAAGTVADTMRVNIGQLCNALASLIERRDLVSQ